MVQITDNQKFSYTFQEVDKKGQPIPGAPAFDAPPTVTVDNPNVVDATLGADGASVDIVGKIPGTATISVTAAVGGNAISGTDQVQVSNSAPAGLNLTAGAVTEQS